jgi:NADPH:quinone reductase-like Zn-dependent oxidoreductase
MSTLMNVEVRTNLEQDGNLRLGLEMSPIGPLRPDEILVRIDAAPLNPSDQILLLGLVDPSTLRETGSASLLLTEGRVPRERLPGLSARLGKSLGVGNEGAGAVIAAGSNAGRYLGHLVALRASTGTFARYQVVRGEDCIVLPAGATARDGASAFINPLTALGMVETMRREGHTALVHTAAASNLGQMLNRLCIADGIPLVNIVRSAEQVDLLRGQGALHVLDSNAEDFPVALVDALASTGATLAFDAIGGGRMAGSILAAMETVALRSVEGYSRYGSRVHKQVYIYGVLDTGPRILEGNFGTAWSVAGWLMTWFYDSLAPADVTRLRARVASELTTTFVSNYSAEVGLAELLTVDAIKAYTRKATGTKFLVLPQKDMP